MDPSDRGARPRRGAVTRVNKLLAGTKLLPVIVACREQEYEKVGIQVSEALPVRIAPLDREQITDFLAQELGRGPDHEALEIWKGLAEDPEADRLWDLIATPWTLTLLVTYLRDAAPIEIFSGMPGESAAVYRHRVEAVLLAQYVPARVRAADNRPYTVAQVQRWSTALAGNLGGEVDIRLTDLWRIGGDRRVRALHAMVVALVMGGAIVTFALSINDWDPHYLFRRVGYSLQNLSEIPRPWILAGITLPAMGT